MAGSLQASNIVYQSKAYPDGVALKTAELVFNPARVAINKAMAALCKHFTAGGSIAMNGYYATKEDKKKPAVTLA